MSNYLVPEGTQDKEAEKAFFNGLSNNIDKYKSHSREEYKIIFEKLGIADDLNGLYILEAGCATGEVGAILASKNARIVGVDISEKMILLNRKLNYNIVNYSCMDSDLENACIFSSGVFDAIVCFEVLHHFPSLDFVIKNFSLWLRPGGIVFVVEPNGGNLVNLMSKFIRRVVNIFFPKLLFIEKLSSANEERDHKFDDYLKIFNLHNFDCELKASLSLRESLPKWYGFSVLSLISVIKWILYCLIDFIPLKSINRGSLLIFKMKLIKR